MRWVPAAVRRHPWPEDPASAAPTKLSNRAIAKQAAEGKGPAGGGAGAGEGGGGGRGGGGGGGGGKKKKKAGAGGSGSGKFPAKKVPRSFKRR